MALTFAAYALQGRAGSSAPLARPPSCGADARQPARHHPHRRRWRACSSPARSSRWRSSSLVALASGDGRVPRTSRPATLPNGPYGVLQAAGLLFFAFAGYARIATLGEEVRDPARTIPRAIPLALGIAVVVYAAVGATALAVLGPDAAGRRARLRSPRSSTRRARPGRSRSCAPGRRSRASARCSPSSPASAARRSPWLASGDLPRLLASVDPRHQVPAPRRAGGRVAVVVLLVALTDLRGRDRLQLVWRPRLLRDRERRRRSRSAPRIGAGRGLLNVAGALGCAVLVVSLPQRAPPSPERRVLVASASPAACWHIDP